MYLIIENVHAGIQILSIPQFYRNSGVSNPSSKDHTQYAIMCHAAHRHTYDYIYSYDENNTVIWVVK